MICCGCKKLFKDGAKYMALHNNPWLGTFPHVNHWNNSLMTKHQFWTLFNRPLGTTTVMINHQLVKEMKLIFCFECYWSTEDLDEFMDNDNPEGYVCFQNGEGLLEHDGDWRETYDEC